jgi:hypothetical protein
MFNGTTDRCHFTFRTGVELYSAFNHKRATAAKCRESHHLRTDATTAVPFRSAVVGLTAFCSGGALMIERTAEAMGCKNHVVRRRPNILPKFSGNGRASSSYHLFHLSSWLTYSSVLEKSMCCLRNVMPFPNYATLRPRRAYSSDLNFVGNEASLVVLGIENSSFEIWICQKRIIWKKLAYIT